MYHPNSNHVFSRIRVAQSYVFCVVFCLFVLVHWAIALSAPLRFITSDIPLISSNCFVAMNYISYLRFPRKYLKYHRVWNSGFSKCIGLFTGLGTFNKKHNHR
jgi:uncharacterized membrane protein